MDLVDLLEQSAKRFSLHKCLICESRSYSFRSLNKKVNQLSFGLQARLGVKEGDRVAVLLQNSPEFIIALFAILKLGAVCVPLNVFLTFDELRYILKDCGAKLLISSSDFLEILDNFIQAREINVILTDKKMDNFLYWNEFFVKDKVEDLAFAINSQDLAVLIYTSGTTGFPKGVMLSHNNLCSNVLSSIEALKLNRRDRFLLILPMFHSFTLTVCILIPLYIGARVVIFKSLKPFRKVLRAILLNRISVIVGIPQVYDIFKNLNLPRILQLLLRIRVCISGAAPLSLETLRSFRDKFRRITLLEGYGLTEASPVVSINPLSNSGKAGSVGLPIPGVRVKIAREDESEAACEEVGELIIKGPNVMRGYWNRPQETEGVIKGGWLFSGDMAKIDSDGYIYIVGRKKELIILHGMNIYPSEIENVLKGHPKIKEVAVVGKKDKFKGEVPLAFIVLEKDVSASGQEFTDYCKGRLASYKIPRLVKFKE